MSGSSVPYHLRVNKHVDRMLFFELLQNIGTVIDFSSYGYISLAGPFLEDSRLAHELLHFDKVVSYDASPWVVERQIFNRPYSVIDCRQGQSSDMIRDYGSLIEKKGVANWICWLDYTDPGSREEQLSELEALVAKAECGDIIRVTLNANMATLHDSRVDGASAQKLALHEIEAQLGNYFPKSFGLTWQRMNPTTLAKVIAEAVKLAAIHGAQNGQFMVKPLLVTRYADSSHQMVTVTLLKTEKGQWDTLEQRATRCGWSSIGASWQEVTEIAVPAISLKEKLEIDRSLGKAAHVIAGELGFKIAENSNANITAIKQYLTYYKKYPTFAKIAF